MGERRDRFLLVRFFDRRDWAEQFRSGVLHTTHINTFRGSSGGRGDRHEGYHIRDAGSPHPVRLPTVFGPDGDVRWRDNSTIPRFHMTTSLTHTDSDRYLYCMTCFRAHAGPKSRLPEVFGRILEDVSGSLDRLIGEFGRYAVIVLDTNRFHQHVVDACKKYGWGVSAGLVRYYAGAYHDAPVAEGPFGNDWELRNSFWKEERYRYQKEYRFAFQPSEPLIYLHSPPRWRRLQMRSLGDVTHLFEARDLPRILREWISVS